MATHFVRAVFASLSSQARVLRQAVPCANKSAKYQNWLSVSTPKSVCRMLTTEPSSLQSNSSKLPAPAVEASNRSSSSQENLRAKQALEECFDVESHDIHLLVQKYPKLLKQCKLSTIRRLKDLGIKRETFVQFPWLSTMDADDIDTRRAVIAKAYPDMGDINICAALLQYDAEKLDKFVFEWQLSEDRTKSKFHYLAKFFDVPLKELISQVDQKKFLVTTSFEKTHRILTMLTEAGVDKDDIYRDLWILRHNYHTIKVRLNAVQEAGVKQIKPRLLRANSDVFYLSIKRHAEYGMVLDGHISMTSYLCCRLNCQPSDVQFMYSRWPMVKSVNPAKVKEMIDYLLGEGFTANHILMTPRVLCHKVSTIRERVEELKKLGYNFGTLSLLCRTSTRYQQMLQSIKEEKTRKKGSRDIIL